ncbi:uncharacterized protein LOC110661527 isoform X2 [Hevea brasiliensis]|uniref:uncharacterized protein LOC110661527 isoform X2 n=1 Tax=Hevea brasiliensis TaxID=3981 RepID=UPI0025D16EC4|nr:uncharacterized protein LOC110661527 isoform X2 [Hevea brasiliensis]
MDSKEVYEIDRTADFIHCKNFTKVALQFPDELLKDSVRVVSALRDKLQLLRESVTEQNGDSKQVRLFVMADTTYGSCCVDEVGASHANADCVIHYGHTCLSPTSTLPAFFVFGKASISISNCAKSLSDYASTNSKPIVVVYGLEYVHAIPHVREELVALSSMQSGPKHQDIHFADVVCSVINPSDDQKNPVGLPRPVGDYSASVEVEAAAGSSYRIGGLIWELPNGHRMEDYLLVWVGSSNSAFANVVLTFNGCEIVRYDALENRLVTDLSQQRRILKRRYYLVEKAKDANIVGILVGTLGVAGYLDMIHQMKELITSAGKKAYTLVMGRPNPAKLANFPECDVFIYVSCAQTALLDSKEFLAPVITPFEAMVAFGRGKQWSGEYVMEFRDLINSSPVEAKDKSEEARFSFMQGRYVEDFDLQVLILRQVMKMLLKQRALKKMMELLL